MHTSATSWVIGLQLPIVLRLLSAHRQPYRLIHLLCRHLKTKHGAAAYEEARLWVLGSPLTNETEVNAIAARLQNMKGTNGKA